MGKRQTRAVRQNRQVEKRLTELERRLVEELQSYLGGVGNTSADSPTEFLDLVMDGELDYISAVSAEAGSDTVREIQQALTKLREGTYGVCDDCGEQISARRLEARPFATLCIRCKERFERRLYRQAPRAYARGTADVQVDLNGNEDVDAEPGLDGLLREVEDLDFKEMF